MTLDPGFAAIVVVVATLIGTAVGAGVQRYLARQDRKEAETRLDDRERKARIREYELRRIDHTRRQIERTRNNSIAALAGDTTIHHDPELEHSDMSLVGDAKAARLMADALLGIATTIREHADSHFGELPRRLQTPEEADQMLLAREAVMRALDVQERRALADEPLVVLEPTDYR